MCLGVPGKVVTCYDDHGVRMGKVDFAGVVKEVCLEYVPELQVGDYAIVHVGFAIQRLDEAAAQATLDTLRSLGMLDAIDSSAEAEVSDEISPRIS